MIKRGDAGHDREAVELQQHGKPDQRLSDQEGRGLRHADLSRRNRPRPRPLDPRVEIAIGDVVPGAAGAAHDEGPDQEQRQHQRQGREMAGDTAGERGRPPARQQQQPRSDRPVEAGEPQIGARPGRRAGVDPVAGRVSNAGGSAAHRSPVIASARCRSGYRRCCRPSWSGWLQEPSRPIPALRSGSDRPARALPAARPRRPSSAWSRCSCGRS